MLCLSLMLCVKAWRRRPARRLLSRPVRSSPGCSHACQQHTALWLPARRASSAPVFTSTTTIEAMSSISGAVHPSRKLTNCAHRSRVLMLDLDRLADYFQRCALLSSQRHTTQFASLHTSPVVLQSTQIVLLVVSLLVDQKGQRRSNLGEPLLFLGSTLRHLVAALDLVPAAASRRSRAVRHLTLQPGLRRPSALSTR
jgi:hypothetical protein